MQRTTTNHMEQGSRSQRDPNDDRRRRPPGASGAGTQRSRRATAALATAVGVIGSLAFTWPWEARGPWPRSSEHPVSPRPQSPIRNDDAGFRFVAFGDQRALADGEWQDMMPIIGRLCAQDPKIAFVADTGDIVQDGSHSDQFAMLAEILRPIDRWPYLVAVGNHETHFNREESSGVALARRNTHTFLAETSPNLSADQLYHAHDIGKARLLFLDTNDLVYGDTGDLDRPITPPPDSRGAAQLTWLESQLRLPPQTVVVFMHHPLIHTSRKHSGQAQALWSIRWKGRILADIFADAGVDLIVTGHTHTFERLRLRRRSDGHAMAVVNLSGRPRTSFLWFGRDARKARAIKRMNSEWFSEEGWEDMAGWDISQPDLMPKPSLNQFALVSVEPDGTLSLEVHFIDEDAPRGTLRRPRAYLP